MKPPQIVNSLFLLAFAMGIFALPYDQATGIDRLMSTLHERGQFNGGIIVSIAGKPIYRKAFGYANFKSHTPFTPETISNIGSVAKQFTAMTIMMLAERNKIKYDDAVTKYIPELAGTLGGITLRHLLNHTSGIPDVGDLGIDHPKLTNDEVLKRLSKPGFLVSTPGEKYRYSNPNYVLLAVVVERVSGQRFSDFLSENILKTLGIRDTLVYDGSPNGPMPTAMAFDQFGNLADDDALITGSSGIYSTLDVLL